VSQTATRIQKKKESLNSGEGKRTGNREKASLPLNFGPNGPGREEKRPQETSLGEGREGPEYQQKSGSYYQSQMAVGARKGEPYSRTKKKTSISSVGVVSFFSLGEKRRSGLVILPEIGMDR